MDYVTIQFKQKSQKTVNEEVNIRVISRIFNNCQITVELTARIFLNECLVFGLTNLLQSTIICLCQP